MRRAIASFSRRSPVSPSSTWSPPPSVKVRSSRPACTEATPPGRPAPRSAESAAAAPRRWRGSGEPTTTGTSFFTQSRGRLERRACGSCFRTRPSAATRNASLPGTRRTTSTGTSRLTTTRSVCGKSRSYVKLRTPGIGSRRDWTVEPPTLRRLVPTTSESAARTCARRTGVPPRTSIVLTAKTDVSRAPTYARTASTTRASPTATERRDGAISPSSGSETRAGRAATRTVVLRRAATALPSPRARLPLQRRQLERSQEPNLVLELDSEALVHPPPGLGHQREAVGRRRPARVLDEVRVPRGDDGASDPVALEAAHLDRAPRPELGARVLEDAAERPLVRRLRRLPPGEQLGDRRLDRFRTARLEREPHLRDHLARPQTRVPVGEVELRGPERARPVGVDDHRVDEHVAPLASVGPGVHADAAAGAPGDRRRELEASQPGSAGPVQADRVRRAAPGDERLAVDVRGGELAREPEHECVDAGVVDEQVRAEPDDLDCHAALARPAERVDELVERLRPGEEPCPAAGADRRVPRERDVLVDHGSSIPTARSTSPAPSTSRTSPSSARRRSRSAPCSTAGVHPARTPRSDSASTISFPVTPGTGRSRAG